MEHKFCSTISIFLSTITFFCCSNALKNELVSLKWRRRYLVSLIHFLLYLWSKPILRSIDKEIPLSFISIFGCSICFESIERSHWTMSVNQGREAVTARVIYNDWAENRAYIFRWALGGTYKKGLEHIRLSGKKKIFSMEGNWKLVSRATVSKLGLLEKWKSFIINIYHFIFKSFYF